MTVISNMHPGDGPTDIAIEVQKVSKTFKLYHSLVTGPLKELLFFWKRSRYHKSFMAVDNVSLTVRRGEVVGVIGPNGAGKTTLLKMIAGLLPIDQGSISVHGTVTALLALGVGIHPEFTGRENIYYNGLLLGMSKEEVLAKTPAIIEFAELGQFIDRPFRTYSSGMRARLMFSISMSIDPDILIVDEALATGDAYFVTKCKRRILELCEQGSTILFVSHNLLQVQDICQRAFFMAAGQIKAEGTPSEVVAAYNNWVFQRDAGGVASLPDNGLKLQSGSGEVQITSIRWRQMNGSESVGFRTGQAVTLEIDYHSEFDTATEVHLFVGFLRSVDGAWVGEISTRLFTQPGAPKEGRPLRIGRTGTLVFEMDRLLLVNNEYSLWIMIYKGAKTLCEYRGVGRVFVARNSYTIDRGPVFWQPCRVTIREPHESSVGP